VITTVGEVAEHVTAALRATDFAALANCLSPSVRFRALLPGGMADASGRHAAVALLSDWLEADLGYTVVHARCDLVGPRLHLSFRVRIEADDGPRVMEQEAYCDVSAQGISAVQMLCSGVVPLTPPFSLVFGARP
jgi:hypothetical protein